MYACTYKLSHELLIFGNNFPQILWLEDDEYYRDRDTCGEGDRGIIRWTIIHSFKLRKYSSFLSNPPPCEMWYHPTQISSLNFFLQLLFFFSKYITYVSFYIHNKLVCSSYSFITCIYQTLLQWTCDLILPYLLNTQQPSLIPLSRVGYKN